LQCHKDEADEAFAAAWEQEPEAGSCLQTLVRKHLARQFELEHELVLGDAGRTDPLDLTLLAAASDGNDFAATALPGLKALNASRDLYVGNFGRAEEQFSELLQEASTDDHASRSLRLCGLAAAQENQGERAAALVSLEAAGWHANCVDGTFSSVRQAARLASLYIYFRRSNEADAWSPPPASGSGSSSLKWIAIGVRELNRFGVSRCVEGGGAAGTCRIQSPGRF
jgi:hypothetical protein